VENINDEVHVNLEKLKRSIGMKLGIFFIIQLIYSYMLSLPTSPATSAKDISHLIIMLSPSGRSKCTVLFQF
jgi:hypothetical protein